MCVGVGGGVCAFVFTYERGHTFGIFPTNEDTQKTEDVRPRFFKALQRELYSSNLHMGGRSPIGGNICKGPRCGG